MHWFFLFFNTGGFYYNRIREIFSAHVKTPDFHFSFKSSLWVCSSCITTCTSTIFWWNSCPMAIIIMTETHHLIAVAFLKIMDTFDSLKHRLALPHHLITCILWLFLDETSYLLITKMSEWEKKSFYTRMKKLDILGVKTPTEIIFKKSAEVILHWMYADDYCHYQWQLDMLW